MSCPDRNLAVFHHYRHYEGLRLLPSVCDSKLIQQTLIMEDLRVHPLSKISDIAERIPDIDMKEIRKTLYSMVGKEIEKEGTRFNRKYYMK